MSMSINSARSSLIRTLHMDAEGLFPECIRDRILSVPCRRMLREVHGGKWRAIWYWVWNDFRMWCWLQRSRVYLTKEEREYDGM
jgi:hypothetical protein